MIIDARLWAVLGVICQAMGGALLAGPDRVRELLDVLQPFHRRLNLGTQKQIADSLDHGTWPEQRHLYHGMRSRLNLQELADFQKTFVVLFVYRYVLGWVGLVLLGPLVEQAVPERLGVLKVIVRYRFHPVNLIFPLLAFVTLAASIADLHRTRSPRGALLLCATLLWLGPLNFLIMLIGEVLNYAFALVVALFLVPVRLLYSSASARAGRVVGWLAFFASIVFSILAVLSS